MANQDGKYGTTTRKATTVLLGAEECGVQHRSLASFLIFSIPADLCSYLRSIGSNERSATHKSCIQNAVKNCLSKSVLIFKFPARHVLKKSKNSSLAVPCRHVLRYMYWGVLYTNNCPSPPPPPHTHTHVQNII